MGNTPAPSASSRGSRLLVVFLINEQRHPIRGAALDFRIKGLAAADGTQIIASRFLLDVLLHHLYMQNVLASRPQGRRPYIPVRRSVAISAGVCPYSSSASGRARSWLRRVLAACGRLLALTDPGARLLPTDLLPGEMIMSVGSVRVVSVQPPQRRRAPGQGWSRPPALINASFQLGAARLGLAIFSAIATSPHQTTYSPATIAATRRSYLRFPRALARLQRLPPAPR